MTPIRGLMNETASYAKPTHELPGGMSSLSPIIPTSGRCKWQACCPSNTSPLNRSAVLDLEPSASRRYQSNGALNMDSWHTGQSHRTVEFGILFHGFGPDCYNNAEQPFHSVLRRDDDLILGRDLAVHHAAHQASGPLSLIPDFNFQQQLTPDPSVPVFACKRTLLGFYYCSAKILPTRPCLRRLGQGIKENMSETFIRHTATACMDAAKATADMLP
ncbi:hypothetical protein K469DRAFT_684569 [Zopfia rhizophila CBS 207.26]|uniref:Uncharacterized protein n=1 Tax=Zopfia rhizophila CBS 207.26 TaxID=1314779 RepID=A0A6A6E9H3_9PEZI|nr:hypothetical protein K469DRAFT_684569 [Zopfia rhizophila CBS 207.26]